jgi:hypothetical protein
MTVEDLHSEEYYYVYCSGSHINDVMMGQLYVAQVREKRSACRILLGKPQDCVGGGLNVRDIQ